MNIDVIKDLFETFSSNTISYAGNPIEYGISDSVTQRKTILFLSFIRSSIIAFFITCLVLLLYTLFRVVYILFNNDANMFIGPIILYAIIMLFLISILLFLAHKFCEYVESNYQIKNMALMASLVTLGILLLIISLHLNVSSAGASNVNVSNINASDTNESDINESDTVMYFNFENFSWENTLLIIVFELICFASTYTFNLSFCLYNMSNLSFVYFYNAAGTKVYIYQKRGEQFMCGYKDYLKCNDSKDFENKVSELSSTIRSKLFYCNTNTVYLTAFDKYIEEIKSYSGYIKKYEQKVKIFFDRMNEYAQATGVSYTEKDTKKILKYIKKQIGSTFTQLIATVYVDKKDVKELFPVRNTAQQFYFKL